MTGRPRLPDWRPRLYAAIDAHRGHAFAWGSHDCGILAADAVLAMTGVDLGARFRGEYTTLAGALRALEAAGYDDQVGVAEAHLSPIEPAFAGDGDLAAVPTEEGWMALGVIIGPHVHLFARDGLTVLPRAVAARAFKVF